MNGIANGTVPFLTISGIPIRLHFTFLMLIAFLVFISATDQKDSLSDSIVILSLFASVLLHELGHALVARRYQVQTVEIVMYLIGGVARLASRPAPRQELWIALAGPAVNVLIAAALWGILQISGPQKVLLEIAQANLGLAAFNMLPAFPMDGGRVLRSLLSFRYDDLKATGIASTIGRGLAVVMGLYGIWQEQWILAFIAFFIFNGAQQEYFAQQSSTLMRGALVKETMLTEFHRLSHGSSVREAAEQLLATSQQDFPVVHGEQVLGLLSRDALLQALANEAHDTYVGSVMNRDFLRLEPNAGLEQILPQLSDNGYTALVMEGDALLGMVTRENLNEFLILRNFGVRRSNT
jgi:Zn-dependent protease/predicted transcriptional regulator